MDLSKAFDCIPHDLFAAKLHAYGLSEDAVTFVHSYLKHIYNTICDARNSIEELIKSIRKGELVSH